MLKALAIAIFLGAVSALAQSNAGELRLAVSDASGLGLKSSVELVSEANQYRQTFTTDEHGDLVVRRLPYGIYELEIRAAAFAAAAETVAIHSALPVRRAVRLRVAAASQAVTVHASGTLIDPYRAGTVNEMGAEAIADRLTSLPGRSIEDLVNSEPGWLYEGNAVLHPRGSEYQTQFVIDGIPLTDNRSPGFGPSIAANDIQSMTVYTAGIPAEYGRSLGGVVVVNTIQNEYPGLDGQFTVLGGSYATAGLESRDEYTRGKNSIGLNASAERTSHYLNPVVPQNYTNSGATGDFSLSFERQFTANDHLAMIARREMDRYDIPDELVQKAGGYVPDGSNTAGCGTTAGGPPPADCVYIPGGQAQTGDNFESMGIASYEHIFSPKTMGAARGMARDTSLDFDSNPASWPVNVTQHNSFKEIFFDGEITSGAGKQEWKAGVQADNKFLHEDFSYAIPDCGNAPDPRCPFNVGVLDVAATGFSFAGSRPDLEQGAYVEDAIQAGNWSLNAGLRWDHYQLVVNRNAVSPRIAVSRYFPSFRVKVHGSYDRVFMPPSFENILLSSSPLAQALDTSVPVVQLPVEPSRGNYYQLGATSALFGKLRLDADMYRRDLSNYADDSQIFSTGISFPIAFRKAVIYGAEGKLDVEHWGRFAGFASYSYMVGNVWNPVTGGLFLGGDAIGATSQLTGYTPDSQDQRNTLRDRVRYQVTPRLWIALGSQFNSGLPFQADQTVEQNVSEYGQAVVNHLNLDRGRIHPCLTENASVSADLYRKERVAIRLQADGENLTNTLELLDFGGLFSGNAVGPGRTFTARLETTF